MLNTDYKQEKAEELKLKDIEDYEVHITRDQMLEIFAFVDAVNSEISGLGDVEIVDNKIIKITKLRMFKQECSSAETEIKIEHLEELNNEFIKSGEDQTKLRLWWHSHANMGTFWSGQDETCIKSLLACWGWCLSIVVNKKRSLLARIDGVSTFMGKPVTISIQQLKVVVTETPNVELTARVKEQVEQMVEKPKAWTSSYSSHQFGAYGRGWENNNKQSNRPIMEPFITGRFLPTEGWINPNTGEVWDWQGKCWKRITGASQEHIDGLLTQMKDSTIKKNLELGIKCGFCECEDKVKYSTFYNKWMCKWCRMATNGDRKAREHAKGK